MNYIQRMQASNANRSTDIDTTTTHHKHTGKLTAAETAPGTVQNIAKAAERMSWSFMLRLCYVQLVVVKNYGSVVGRWRSGLTT